MITAGRYRSWATTHDGTRRKHNEDAFVNRPDLGLWAVADGAGGHTAGDLASGMIAEALVAAALERQTNDNVTAVVVELG